MEDPGAPRRLKDLDPRPGPWRADALHGRPCPMCGEPGEARFVRPDELVVRLCELCGTWFVSPAPDAEQLAGFYRGYHQHHRVGAFRGTRHADRYRLPSFDRPDELAARIRGRDGLQDLRVRELASTAVMEGARVLDVGCGTGQLLWLLETMGATGTGVDVDPAAAAFVEQRLGLRCLNGTIHDVQRGATYDLIVLQDLLEHVLDPRAVLERAVDLLTPGGLVYLWTPNATFVTREPEPEVFRADFEHLQFLQARTVTYLARELGLELLHLESVGHLRSGENGKAGSLLRRTIKRLPGVETLARLRSALRDRHLDRSGNYHLLVLLRKPQARAYSSRNSSVRRSIVK